MDLNTGYIKLNGIVIDSLEEGKLSLTLSSDHLNPYGIVHGGVLFTLADNSMGMFLAKYGKFVTINSSIDFLKSSKGKVLYTKPEVVKIGKNISVMNCYITDDLNEIIAKSSGTYYKID